MFNEMKNWSVEYQQAEKDVYSINGKNACDLTKVKDLRHFDMKKSAHAPDGVHLAVVF